MGSTVRAFEKAQRPSENREPASKFIGHEDQTGSAQRRLGSGVIVVRECAFRPEMRTPRATQNQGQQARHVYVPLHTDDHLLRKTPPKSEPTKAVSSVKNMASPSGSDAPA